MDRFIQLNEPTTDNDQFATSVFLPAKVGIYAPHSFELHDKLLDKYINNPFAYKHICICYSYIYLNYFQLFKLQVIKIHSSGDHAAMKGTSI